MSSTNVPSGGRQRRVLNLPDRQPGRVVAGEPLDGRERVGAGHLDLAHVADVERPARVRTAMCSSVMPEYSTGMSQPPNSTIRAPLARCRACSAVFFKLTDGLEDIVGDARTVLGTPRRRLHTVLSAAARIKEEGH